MRKVDIYKYTWLPGYLKTVHRLNRKDGFTYGELQKLTGLHKSTLYHIFDGTRYLYGDKIDLFIKILRLGKRQALYFRLLVYLTRAKASLVKRVLICNPMRPAKYQKRYPQVIYRGK